MENRNGDKMEITLRRPSAVSAVSAVSSVSTASTVSAVIQPSLSRRSAVSELSFNPLAAGMKYSFH